MIRVSIIIPVYNAEKWLNRCLDSVCAQCLSDLEIILVNDGSNDNSGNICDQYARKDSRIKVLHQSNHGVSASRQKAIDIAQGEYVAFVDADDCVESSFTEIMVSKAYEEHADLVICDYYAEKPGETRVIRQQPVSLDHHAIQIQLNNNLLGTLWNKLIRRSIFTAYSISFPCGLQYGEDKYVLMHILNNPVKVAYVPYALYHFDQRSNLNSLTRAQNANVFKNMIQFYLLMLDDFDGEIKDGLSYIMVFYSFRMLTSDFLSSRDYALAYHGKRNVILKAKGRLYKRIGVFLATFKAGWPISQFILRLKSSL